MMGHDLGQQLHSLVFRSLIAAGARTVRVTPQRVIDECRRISPQTPQAVVRVYLQYAAKMKGRYAGWEVSVMPGRGGGYRLWRTR